MPGLALALGLGLTGRSPFLVAPPGYAFLVDDDGAYLVDSDGAFLITEAA